jgi:glycosyltransferase involved in cell wall biosynthesis
MNAGRPFPSIDRAGKSDMLHLAWIGRRDRWSRLYEAMKILHVIASMDPAFGGPPAVAGRLAAAQAGLGHEVAVMYHDSPGRSRECEASLATIPGIGKVQFQPVSNKVILEALIPKPTQEQLRRAIGQCDIVHLHSVWDPIIRQAGRDAKRLGRPYVVTPHGVLDAWSLKQRWLKKKIALLLVFRRMLQNAACLHLLNQDESDLIEPLRLGVAKRVIPNGVFVEEIEPRPVPGSFLAERSELSGQRYVLFLSRLHHKKGLDYLADAFAQVATKHADVRLVVAGPDGGAQKDFEERIAAQGVKDRVHLVGPLWGRQKLSALADAACFCLPSRQEGFSVAILEALAMATPVVVSEQCHFPEVAQAGAGEVVKLEASAVAAAIDEMLNDSQRARTMGQAGRTMVMTRYLWPVIAQQTISMYRLALNQPEKPDGLPTERQR